MLRLNLLAPANPTGCGVHGQCLGRELIQLEKEGKLQFHWTILHDKVHHSISPVCRDIITEKLMSQKGPLEDADLFVFLGTADGGGYKRLPGKKRIAYSVFETSLLSPTQKDFFLRTADEVWVPTEWAKDLLDEQKIYIPSRVVPEGADYLYGAVWEQGPPRQACGLGGLGALTLLNVGKWELRKGHRVLLGAAEMISEQVPVILNTFWHNPWDKDGAVQYLASIDYEDLGGVRDGSGRRGWRKDDLTVILNQPVQWQTELTHAYSMTDLAVYPHFGEGWGLPILEAIVNGVPTIAPNITGSCDYMNHYDQLVADEFEKVQKVGHPLSSPVICDNSYDGEIANDGIFFHGDKGKWYPTNPENIAHMILTKNWDLWPSQRERVRKAMAEKYSWRESAEAFLEACNNAVQ